MAHVSRELLQQLLEQWQLKQLTERDVHERAEILWNQVSTNKDYAEHEYDSIAFEVLSNLDILNHQLITVDDIPAMISFLRTPYGSELDGWQAYKEYWNNIDWTSRRASLADNPYYITSTLPDEDGREQK